MATLIIDNGASKAEWIWAAGVEILGRARIPGIYHLQLTDEEVIALFREAKATLPATLPPVDKIFFYSTGTRMPQARLRLAELLLRVFSDAKTVDVESDMLAAARALCQNEAGIACIMGTGSNACRYDGRRIVEQAGGLGYILGDEGSGAGLGKRLLGVYLDRQMPRRLEAELQDVYELSPEKVIENVYQKPLPNRYLASFAPFLNTHRHDPFVAELLRAEFARFFTRYILPFQQSQSLPVNALGSIAFHFRETVIEAAQVLGLKTETITRDPIEGLVRFHV